MSAADTPPTIPVGDPPIGRPDQVHDTRLNHGSWPSCFDCLRQAFEPITADDEHIPDATIGQVGTYLRPKRCAFFFRDPQSQDVFDPVDINPDGHVGGLIDYPATIADFDPLSVQEDDWVELV